MQEVFPVADHAAQPSKSGSDKSTGICLRCNRTRKLEHIAYASSRNCIETGKVCHPCWLVMLKEQRRAKIYAWGAGWSRSTT